MEMPNVSHLYVSRRVPKPISADLFKNDEVKGRSEQNRLSTCQEFNELRPGVGNEERAPSLQSRGRFDLRNDKRSPNVCDWRISAIGTAYNPVVIC